MHILMPTKSDLTQVVSELDYYLQRDTIDKVTSVTHNAEIKYSSQHFHYRLPLGELQLLKTTVYLPQSATTGDIETARKSAIKSASECQKLHIQQNHDDNESGIQSYYVFIIDIQLMVSEIELIDAHRELIEKNRSVTSSFGARYFMEECVIDVSDTQNILQIFGWQDWQTLLATVKTSSELWRFLEYHIEQLQYSSNTGIPSFDSEQMLLNQFMLSSAIFAKAIAIDNALIKYGMQEVPNSALVTMSLAQKNNSPTLQMYTQHMQQAALVWAQLSTQMIEMASESKSLKSGWQADQQYYNQWQQQLLDESLFSRHELIRTLYRHPKQSTAMQESGYVVHQHSYESLGRHYVLIFCGHAANSKQSRALIKPNLDKIAQDVATRLPLAELHHIVVLGIDLVREQEEIFFDIDLWLQPVTAMTQKERQLTKQLQRLSKQQQNKQQSTQKDIDKRLPSLKLNLSIPARIDKTPSE